MCTAPGVRERVDNLRNAVQDNTLEVFTQKTAEGQDGAQQQGDVRAAETWKVLLSLFRANSRDELVALLGYSKEKVKARVGEVLVRLKESQRQRDEPQEEQPADADEGTEQVTHEPVVSFAEPEPELEPELELDGEQESEEKTSSEVGASDVLPQHGESTTTASSLFGDDPIGPFQVDTGVDLFSTMTASHQDDSQDGPLTIPRSRYAVDSSVAVTIGSGPSSVASASEVPCSRGNTFRICPSDESETDQFVTKAYFSCGAVKNTYIRLFESIVTNHLADLV